MSGDHEHETTPTADRAGSHRRAVRRRLLTTGVVVALAGGVALATTAAAEGAEHRAAQHGAGVSVSSPASPASPVAPAPAPTPATPAGAAPPAAPALPVTDTCAVTAGLDQAVAHAASQGVQASAAVLDTLTGTYVSAGDADTPYDTASVVKVLIATQLLLRGEMTGSTATTAHEMVVLSDDDDADALYDQAGGDAIVTDVAQHYGITDLGSPPAEEGEWGETTVTADGLVHLYAALRADPTVWPWLSQAMSAAQQTAADGTDQYFGIPSATSGWAVKQGWMVGLGPGATYDTTGFVDGDRYAVVILTHGSAADYTSVLPATITTMARDVMPAGTVGAPTAACPA